MGKTFGLISLLLGLVGIVVMVLAFFVFAIPFAMIIIWTVAILAVVFGAIGIAKDDSKGLGVVGLILGILTIVLNLLLPMFLIGLLLGSLF